MKDLTSHLVPDLVLDHHGTQYVVPPPSKDDGLLLAALNIVGTKAIANAMGDEDITSGLSPVQKKLFEASKERDLGEISLGPVYAEMVDDGLPGPHIDQYALYAMYYWVLGEATADEIFKTMSGAGDSPKDRPKRSKSGQSTE